MARKNKTITITDDNRDKGKSYYIEEMSAFDALRWARRALSAVDIDSVDFGWLSDLTKEGLVNTEMAGVAAIGAIKLLRSIDPDEMERLLDEMLWCCHIIPSPGVQPRSVMKQVDGDVEEPTTLFKLQLEALSIHLDFLKAANSRITGL